MSTTPSRSSDTSIGLDTQTVVVWLNQAAAFAKRDNFYEAVSRLKYARSQIELMEGAADTASWAGLLGQIDAMIAEYGAALEAWTAKIAAGRQGRTDAAAEEMARPLPIPADK